ncbi:MAG: ubiquinone/menaquinone biosynthesis methyltransferase [Elusimicrobiota bacterium]
MKSSSPIREMFDALVPEYDRFNRISSLGLDQAWRRELARMFNSNSSILDVGTGTGDLAKELLSKGCSVVGVDFSEPMIEAAQKKLGSNDQIRFQVASADELPFEPKSFDGITSSFVLRNLNQGGILTPSLREFFRVTKPGGKMVHLELSRPPNNFLAWGHKTYLKTVLPLVGWLNFGERWPKDYLEKTIYSFPEPQQMCQYIRWAGFNQASYHPLIGGIAGLYVGVRC